MVLNRFGNGSLRYINEEKEVKVEKEQDTVVERGEKKVDWISASDQSASENKIKRTSNRFDSRFSSLAMLSIATTPSLAHFSGSNGSCNNDMIPCITWITFLVTFRPYNSVPSTVFTSMSS